MTNAITLIADHKGFTRPKVVGDDYIVLADCAISAYRTGTTATAASQTITAATAGDTCTSAGITRVVAIMIAIP